MATYVVTTLVDESNAGATEASPGGAGLSLREAIALTNAHPGADTITFAAGVAGGTIRLGSTLSVSAALTIDGDIDNDGTADILITGDVNNDDTTVGATDITDIFATAAANLDDNVRIISATGGGGLGLTLDGLTLTGGVAGGDTASGGAVMATIVTLTNSTVSGNSAGFRGGGISVAVANLTNSTVSGNSAKFGGGIATATANLTNSTVSGNRATEGGGIDAISSANLTNSTVSGNLAFEAGGGIFAGTANLTNSIVLGNIELNISSGDDVSAETVNYAGLNIVGIGAETDVSDGVINAASVGAVFAALGNVPGTNQPAGKLADNGGPVQTIALRPDASNPAIDAGNDALDAPTDARGEARRDVQGIAHNGANISDLGAFEVQTAATASNLSQNKSYSSGDASVALADIVVSDPDVGDAITARLTLANPAAGALTTSGAATYAAATGVWTITGTVAQVNAALAAVTFVPAANFNGDTTIATHIEDAQGDGPADGTITLDGPPPPVNEAPAIGSNGGDSTAVVQVAENIAVVTTVTASDPESAALAFTIAGGADAALFVIDAATGARSFGAAPDFEAPDDANHDNLYEVTVQVSDGAGGTDTQALSVAIENVPGVTIVAGKGKNIVDAGNTVPGQPLPTEEEDVITGGKSNDKLSGLGGDDLISGGRGKNVLTGGLGDDSFVFDTKLGQGQAGTSKNSSYAKITDFGVGNDGIELSQAVFKKLDLGVLSDAAFRDVGEAGSKADRIVYKQNGNLLYDKDGKGGADAIVFAKLTTKPDIDASDFLVVV